MIIGWGWWGERLVLEKEEDAERVECKILDLIGLVMPWALLDSSTTRSRRARIKML